MKKTLIFAVIVTIVLGSCQVHMGKRVKGNGRAASIQREVADASRIKLRGSMNVEIIPGNSGIRVEADENLLPYIITRMEDGWLVIKTKDDVSIRTKNPMTVYVSTNMLKAVNLSGSGNITGNEKFSGAERLDVYLTGSGNIDLDVNTPQVNVDLRGSGSVTISGETRDARVNLTGSGAYRADALKTEHTNIDLRGSGDAHLHADAGLDAEVRGSGSVYYRGNASAKIHTSGSGRVRQVQ